PDTCVWGPRQSLRTTLREEAEKPTEGSYCEDLGQGGHIKSKLCRDTSAQGGGADSPRPITLGDQAGTPGCLMPIPGQESLHIWKLSLVSLSVD
ncbi:hypothetical protein P7K49_006049, partial [Saguinus oedipus]